MKNAIIFIILGILISCTKQLVVEPEVGGELEKENTKLEITRNLGEKKSSQNKYNVVIIDHIKNSKIEYPVPKDKKWTLPIDLGNTKCHTMGEEVGTKDYFLMELFCDSTSEFDIASVVACGPNEKFDAETLRILKDGRPYLTLQIQCSF